jgi:hypothetical protein
MPTDVTQTLMNFANLASILQQQFNRFVSDFNNHAWDDLRTNVLDRNVLVVGIDHPQQHTISGIDRVITFLEASHGHFDPAAPFFQVFGDNGYAIGVGYWTDDDDRNSAILFSFVFINRASPDAPEWKAMRLWASRPLGDLKP